ncbi:MAG: cobalamin B12-binding domain-containing protein [Polyangiales bacterium]
MIHGPHIESFVKALLTSDRLAALGIARRAMRELGTGALYDDLIRPAMARIGHLWTENSITVADEHMATAIAQSVVAMLYGELEWPPPGPKAIVTCAEAERHRFGAQMVSDLLLLDGWDVRDLGGDVPVDAVVGMAKRIEPVFVAISTTLPSHIGKTRRLLEALREADPRIRTLVGGHAVDLLGDRAAELGADAIADSARGAVRVARAWKP